MLKEISKLKVKYRSRDVGTLEALNGEILFQYEEGWIKDGFSLSPFSLPLEEKVFRNPKSLFEGLHGVFADCLPDGWGALVRERELSSKGIDYHALSPLTRLSLVSKNGMGGLDFEPCISAWEDMGQTDFDSLAAAAKKLLGAKKGSQEVYALCGDCGGTRPKADITLDGQRYIIKFPSPYDKVDSGIGEYKANECAKRCGLNVNGFLLLKTAAGSNYFAARRFDREGGKRVHMVSLSALLETGYWIPNLDYLHLLKVTKAICADKNDVYEAFGRMCFNVFYGNKDDHGHNFAFIYDEDLKGYRLSPFYDITKTPDIPEHNMSVNGKGKPREDDLLEVAEICKLSLSRCKGIIERIKDVVYSSDED